MVFLTDTLGTASSISVAISISSIQDTFHFPPFALPAAAGSLSDPPPLQLDLGGMGIGVFHET